MLSFFFKKKLALQSLSVILFVLLIIQHKIQLTNDMKNPKTIDISPTWGSLAPVMIDIIKNPHASFQSTKIAKEELLKMARVADKYIEVTSYNKDGKCVEQYVDLKDSE